MRLFNWIKELVRPKPVQVTPVMDIDTQAYERAFDTLWRDFKLNGDRTVNIQVTAHLDGKLVAAVVPKIARFHPEIKRVTVYMGKRYRGAPSFPVYEQNGVFFANPNAPFFYKATFHRLDP